MDDIWNKPPDVPEWQPPTMQQLFGVEEPEPDKDENLEDVDEDKLEQTSKLLDECKNELQKLTEEYQGQRETVINDTETKIAELIKEN